MAALETDPSFRTSIESLIQLANIRLDHLLQSLLSSLDGLSRVSPILAGTGRPCSLVQYMSASSASELPLDVLQSQIYILHLIDICLTRAWQQKSEANPPPLMDLPRFWPEPPSLEENSARQLLGTVLTYTKMVSSEVNLYPAAGSPAPSKDGRGQASSIVSWGQGAETRSSTSSLTPHFIKSHSYPSTQIDGFVPTLSSKTANTVDCIAEMTRLLGQIAFYLSSSNWPLVLNRVKGRLSHLTTTIEEAPDLIDFRLLEWSNMNRQRLGQVLQEASNSFLHIKRPSQIAFASVLHSAIWNWLECNPIEFDMLVESNRRLEGGPDSLFDVLFSMADFSSSNAKRAAVFYPLMSMLLVLCPDLFRKVVMGDSNAKSSSLSKKYNFLESLRKGLSGNKGFEPSVTCYLDFVKAATLLSPRHETSGLRNLLPEIQNDLKVSSFCPGIQVTKSRSTH